MRFEFFTMGGSQFWEDVFFYQKWRIQRNFRTKKYRLLDPWDIQRHSGGFESCRKAFVDYIEIYEISRQRGHMVIMLHGLGDSKNIFKPLWRAVLKEGMMAAAINYPSTRKRIDSHVRQLEFLLNNLEDVQEVSFVTKGAGGIVLRKLLASKEPWTQKLKINRAVQVCPPNQGSALLTKLASFKFLRKIMGPACNDFAPKEAPSWDKLRLKTEIGAIYTQRPERGILFFLPKSWHKYFYVPDVVKFKGVKEIFYVRNFHLNPLKLF